MRDRYTVKELCDALEVSASGYYKSRQTGPAPRHEANQKLLCEMRDIHADRHTRCYGSPRMTRELRARGLPCSENRVAALMARAGLRAKGRKPFRPETTQRASLVSDITSIPTRERWLYLAVIIDFFSRAVLGWKVAESLETSLLLDALDESLLHFPLEHRTIIHSDRGCQYTSRAFRERLARLGINQSMSAKGYCYDNAFAESAFASLKSELLIDGQPFETKALARAAIFDYIETFYNRKRLHSSIGYQPPEAFLREYFDTNQPSLN